MSRNKVDKYLIITLAVPFAYCVYYLAQGKFLLKGNSDVIDSLAPYFVAVNDAVSTDIIPSWTRLTFTGSPLIGSTTQLWYPPNWVSFVVAKEYVPLTMTVTAWLHFIGVAWAAFIYFREISRSNYWASVSALAFTFSLPVVCGLAFAVWLLPNYMFTLLTLYIIHTAANRSWKLNVAYIALTTFAILTGGFIQFAFYSIPLIFLYSIAIGVFGTETYKKDSRVILYCLGGIALGLLLSAPMLLPLLAVSTETTKDYAGMSTSDISKHIKISPALLWRLFSPNAFGHHITFPGPAMGGINYIESMNAFCGLIMLFLAGYAITVRRSAVVIFWSAIFVVMILMTVTPLVYLHITLFGFKFVYNRVTFLLPLAITSLAAIAGQHIDSKNSISPLRVLINPFWVLLIVVGVMYGVPNGVHMKVEAVRGAIFIYALIFCGLFLCKRNKLAWHLTIFCLVLIEAVWSGHLMANVQNYSLMVRPKDYYTYGKPKNPFPLSKEGLAQYRVVLSRREDKGSLAPFGAKEANQGIFYGYMSPWGYTNAFSSRLAFLLNKLSEASGYASDRMVCFGVEPPFDELADLTSVGFVMDPDAAWHVVQDRRGTCLPRASLFYEYELYEDRTKAVERLKQPDFLPRQTVLLAPKFKAPLGPSDPNSSVKFIKNGNSRLILRVETDTPAILLLTDLFARGWTALVDSKRADIIEGNIAFRAVYVPPGAHKVEFKYRPPLLRLSLLLSLIGISICIALFTLHGIYKARHNKKVRIA